MLEGNRKHAMKVIKNDQDAVLDMYPPPKKKPCFEVIFTHGEQATRTPGGTPFQAEKLASTQM